MKASETKLQRVIEGANQFVVPLFQRTNGAYMELNLSATAIHRFCIQAAELAGLSSIDWHVESEAKPIGDTQTGVPEV